MCFKIDWASLIFGSKFPFFALFYFVFDGKILSTSPRGAYIWRGDLTEGFFALPVGGAYIWRGLYMDGCIFGSLSIDSSMPSTSLFQISRSMSESSFRVNVFHR